ncbi:MAG: cytoplasmic protein [Gaiellales bacterium]|nr:MAG: cytoplasmic protein [Gaiellales bacterium]
MTPLLRGTVAAFNRNLEGLGYSLSLPALNALTAVDLSTASTLMAEVLPILQEIRGVHLYIPMYPNFPAQVMAATDAELYWNAILHYLAVWVSDLTGKGQAWLPSYMKDPRPSLAEEVALTVLDLGTEAEAKQLLTDIVRANTSISDHDKADVRWGYANGLLVLPETIPNKENLAVIAGLLASDGKWNEVASLIRTPTDVLRLATALSEGDLSLAVSTKFRPFNRQERRGLLGLLEQCGADHGLTEDMARHSKVWVRLAEKLHPGEYHQYPVGHAAFDAIRNDKPFTTWYGLLERRIKGGQIDEAIEQLRSRPGEFARRLDHLVRLAPNAEDVLDGFAVVANKVATPVLLQAMTHFKERNNQGDLRVFFPKGNVAKAQAIPNNLLVIPEALCRRIVAICEDALIKRFAKLPSLGNVFVDPRLSGYLVPFSQRSAAKSSRTLVRGSHVPFGNKLGNTLRFFVWWKNITNQENKRVDLDLSAMIYDADWNFMEHIAYTNLRSAHYRAVHSGDITDAPKGACEFIDIDMGSLLTYGGAYLVVTVQSYTGQPFSEIPEASTGWMLRQDPQSGEVFEPKTVVDRLDVTAETSGYIPMIVGLPRREIIWVDAAMKRNLQHVNNVHGNADQIRLLGKAFAQITKPNLYDLFRLHAVARGTLVSDPVGAEMIFAPDQGITPFDIGMIAAQYLVS